MWALPGVQHATQIFCRTHEVPRINQTIKVVCFWIWFDFLLLINSILYQKLWIFRIQLFTFYLPNFPFFHKSAVHRRIAGDGSNKIFKKWLIQNLRVFWPPFWFLGLGGKGVGRYFKIFVTLYRVLHDLIPSWISKIRSVCDKSDAVSWNKSIEP